jgi:hypothetical protein
MSGDEISFKAVICPMCGANGWRSCRIAGRGSRSRSSDADAIEPVDYGSFDYGDDVWFFGVERGACYAVWPSYAELLKAVKGEPHRDGCLTDAEVFGFAAKQEEAS